MGKTAFPKEQAEIEKIDAMMKTESQAEMLSSSFKPFGMFYSTHMILITDYLVIGPLYSCLLFSVGLQLNSYTGRNVIEWK